MISRWLTVLLTLVACTPALAQKTNEASDVEFVGHVLEPRKAPLPDIDNLKVPEGFKVSVFAEGLINPRMIAVAEDGTVYVTRRSVGDVVLLRDLDGDGRADERKVVANRPQMHGITIDGDTVYLVTVKDVYRAALLNDGSFGELERIIDDLPDSGQHPSRTIGIGPDKMLYISVGSTCNACTESSPESATLLRASLDGKKRAIFASGLRNTIGFAWHPDTQELYGMDNNIDWHGDDQPKEEFNRISSGKFYGWPYVLADSFLNPQDDPPGDVTLEQLAEQTEQPLLMYTAHGAPMQLAFYDGSAFPADYRGSAFVAMRGSWNRKPPSGYEVVRVSFENGKPVAIEPFLSGFLKESDGKLTEHGRLVGVAVAKDGSLLVGDDENGVIYRVSFDGKKSDNESKVAAKATVSSDAPPAKLATEELAVEKQSLSVTSNAFEKGQPIPLRYSDYGEKISPPLAWTPGPSETKSYVVIVDDPDAKPKLVNHWTLYNVSSDIKALSEGIPGGMSVPLPKSEQGATTRGSIGYFGPRPPAEDPAHNYHFQVFALDTILSLTPGADRTGLINAMRGHVLAAGTLVGTFDRLPKTQAAAEAAKGLRQ